MIDFFTLDGKPWPRRLWDVGSLLALTELHEAGVWERRRVLSAAAVDWQRAELRRVVGPDIGLGAKELRRELDQLLAVRLPDPSPARRRLRELIDHVRPDYLRRWLAAATAPAESRPRPERIARITAAHLLDLGYDAAFLLHWAENLARVRATTVDMLEAAIVLDQSGPREFAVLAVLAASPQQALAQKEPSWLPAAAVNAWLREHGQSTSGLRGGGGFLVHVIARDPYGAAAQVRLMLDRLTARSSFLRSTRDGIRPHEQLWVDGHPDPIPLASPARGADIISLVQEGQLYQVHGARTIIDDALELAAPINRGAIGPAVAGGWAAIESLLSDPDDPRVDGAGKAIAADRLAAIIACAWPRAELTALAHRHRPDHPDALFETLTGCTTNRDRSAAVAAAILNEHKLAFTRHKAKITAIDSDVAAMERMRKLLADPHRTLAETAQTFTVAMRRFYRARNITVHGGSTQSVTMNAALRTAVPLLGAGLDRIAHGLFTEQIRPIDLAVRAELALQLVGGETGLLVVDLLEPRRRGRSVA